MKKVFKSASNARGMTLVEVMVAMAILLLASVALYTGGFWARAISVENSRKVATTTFVDGLVRQISTFDEGTLADMTADSELNPQTANVQLADITDSGTYSFRTQSLELNAWNDYNLKVGTQTTDDSERHRSGFSADELLIQLYPSVSRTQINPSDARQGYFYEISVSYRYESGIPRRNGGDGMSQTYTVSTVRTFVDE